MNITTFFDSSSSMSEKMALDQSPNSVSNKELEQLSTHLQKLMKIGVSLDEAISDLTSLQKRCLSGTKINKEESRALYAKVQSALDQWMGGFLGKGGDVSIGTEESEQYGFKYSRLNQQQKILSHAEVKGVEVPAPLGLSTELLHLYLGQVAPEIDVEWQKLNRLFAEFQGGNKADFLMQPDVEEKLERITKAIAAAFKGPKAQEFLLREVEGLGAFLKKMEEEGHLLMVRSSGAEDTVQVANAGGNLSLSYVHPEIAELIDAIGQVAASYYGIPSLRNRLNSDAGDNPFAQPQHIAICLQQLIGETPLKDASQGILEKKPPISIVLFSNEPTYVGKESFRIMRLSATYGHGEGVVGAAGVRTDTYMILCSKKTPSNLYVLKKIADKTARLAPVIGSDGQIALQCVKNDEELGHLPALDDFQLARLFYLGRIVESIYGDDKPVDMELVIKGETIYPVQARPVNRPESKPSYVDGTALAQATRYQLEPFLPGKAEVQTLSSPEELLIIDRLEEAQAIFDKTIHKVIIIRQEEPSNSHPVVNFSGLGIPVMYSKDHDAIRTFVDHAISDGKKLLVCVQTETLWAIDSQIDPIKEGYTAHPAQIDLSIETTKRSPLYNLTGKQTQLPKEIKEMLIALRAMKGDAAAQPAIRTLKRTLLESLDQKREWIAALEQRDGSLPHLDTLQKSCAIWEEHLRHAVGEWKRATGSLEYLWHAKVIEQLLVERDKAGQIGCISLMSLEDELKSLNQISAHCARHGGSAQCRFAQEALYRDMMMTEDQSIYWDQFLDHLETAQSKGLITKEEVNAFREGLQRLDSFELLPLWMAHSFLPSWLEDTEDAAINTFHQLCSELPREKTLSHLRDIDDRLSLLQEACGQFAREEGFDKGFAALKEAMVTFTSFKELPEAITADLREQIQKSSSPWKEQIDRATPLEKLIAYRLMNKAVTLYDSSIKAMKSSQTLSNAQKVSAMKRMLPGYYTLLADWHSHLSGTKIPYHMAWPLNRYLEQMERCFREMDNREELLNPSSDFNVGAARLGSVTAFERSLPSTLEDFFTLTHQNLITAVEALNIEELRHIALPNPLNQCTDPIELLFNPAHPEVQMTGCEVTSEGLKLHYNYPQRNHSAQFSLSFDRKSQEGSLKISFFGQARTRWSEIAQLAELYEEVGLCSLSSPPVIKPMSLEINYKLHKTDPSQGHAALCLLKIAAQRAMRNVVLPADQRLQEALQQNKEQNAFDHLIEYKATQVQQNHRKWVIRHHLATQTIPDSYKDDKWFVLQIIKQKGLALEHVSERLKRDPTVLLTAIEQNVDALKYITDWTSFDAATKERILLSAVKVDLFALDHLKDGVALDVQAIERIFLKAVQRNGFALRYLKDGLGLSDLAIERIVLKAVQQNGYAFIETLEWPHFDTIQEHIILATLRQSGLLLEYIIDWELGEAKEGIILAAVGQNGLALQYVKDWTGLETVKEQIILAAVKQNGLALQHITDWTGLETVKEQIILTAVKQNGLALQHITDWTGLETAKEQIVFAALKQNGLLLQHITDWTGLETAKEQIVLAAVKQNGLLLQHITDWTGLETAKKEIVLAAVKQNGLVLQHITDWTGLQTVKEEIILTAVKQNGLLLQHITDWTGLETAKEQIILTALGQNRRSFQHVPQTLKCKSDFTLAILQKFPYLLPVIDDTFKNDRDFALKAIEQNHEIAEWAPLQWFNDPIIAEFLKRSCSARQFFTGLAKSKQIHGLKETEFSLLLNEYRKVK